MHRKTTVNVLYAEDKNDDSCPKTLQQYHWSCLECTRRPNPKISRYEVLESKRRGVTTGMGKHLAKHSITNESHTARIRGYNLGAGKEVYKEKKIWSGEFREQQRLNKKQAMRRWIVKNRMPFSTVETPEFQEMFLAHGTHAAYRSRTTLRNHIFDDFKLRRNALRQELALDFQSISFTLDMWTSPNRTPIFAIIGHWYSSSWEEREEVLDFVEVNGAHTGEALAKVVLALIQDLKIDTKLFAITGDNAGNNGTLCKSLFASLKEFYTDKANNVGKTRMQFHGSHSWIRCFAHIVALMCGDN